MTYMSADEVAARFGVLPVTVARWHTTGRLRAAMILRGGRLVFLRTDVEAFTPLAPVPDDAA